jgi:uncharacterized delta-60 repeat protein
VIFAPTAPGSYADNRLKLSYLNGQQSTETTTPTIALSAIGGEPARLTFVPEALDFGEVSLGSNAQKTIIVTNDSPTRAINLTVSSPPSTTGFQRGSSCNNYLDARASCIITIYFRPSAKQDYSASLSVTFNDGGVNRTVPSPAISLMGKGSDPGGGLDPAFGDEGKVVHNMTPGSSWADAVLVEPDGKVIATGGYYTPTASASSPSNLRHLALTKFDSSGNPDLTFGTAGMAPPPRMSPAGAATGNTKGYIRGHSGLLRQSDGKIIVVGRAYESSSHIGLSRFKGDGTADANFGTAGVVNVKLTYSGMINIDTVTIGGSILLSSGKILVYGGFTGSGYYFFGRLFLMRFFSNGSIDNAFGINGMAAFEPVGGNYNDFISHAEESSTDRNLLCLSNTMVFRVKGMDGSLDSSFATSGKFDHSIPNARAMYVYPDNGGFLVAGMLTMRTSPPQTSNVVVRRFNADLSINTAFGTGGDAIIDVGPWDELQAMLMLPDGRIAVSGYSLQDLKNNGYDYDGRHYGFVWLLKSSGQPDTDFGPDHTRAYQIISDPYENAAVYALSYNPAVGLLAAGFVRDVDTRVESLSITSFQLAGGKNPGFGTQGTAILHMGLSYELAAPLLIQSDGKLIHAGISSAGERYHIYSMRFDASGAVDTTYGVAGKALYVPPQSTQRFYDSMMMPSSALQVVSGQPFSLVGNFVGNNFEIVRFNPAGQLDTSFASSGVASIDIGNNTNDVLRNLLAVPDGRIYAVGATSVVGGQDFGVARLLPNGTLDTTFSDTGRENIHFGILSEASSAVVQQGKVIVAGKSDTQLAVTRLLEDGNLDDSFGSGGRTLITVPNNKRFLVVGKAVVDSTNAIYIAAVIENNLALVKLTPSGVLDTSFSTAGIYLTNENLSNPTYYNLSPFLALTTDNKILIGPAESRNLALLRLYPTGKPDYTFGVNGRLLIDEASLGWYAVSIRSIHPLSDGRFVVGGFIQKNANNPYMPYVYYNDIFISRHLP